MLETKTPLQYSIALSLANSSILEIIECCTSSDLEPTLMSFDSILEE